ncbi:lipid droplet-associated protein [Mycolicibacterium hodleri]|uniref:Lipid droplet-associated protein n=1 Tax=Mycolicibacterium hodleri TaxID=49897 RepID=A0A502EFB5_9MYCO|nr:lipid droplet-associated protein [Mycolicibacterium hodleri]TPG35924.1 lipid droplet-associated protein [Mycolicibacterium hodleri]
MATAPYGVRLLVGAAMTALEETRRLPQTVIAYPMTIVSQLAQLVMKMQQDVADLVNRGDETLDQLFPPKDEQPEWATFDEDAEDAAVDDDDSQTPRNGERLTEGRFALYSTGEPDTREEKPTGKASSATAGIVSELDYESLTLAQLRARLPSLKVADLEALLAFEESTKARAPFQTLLANRITRASAK